MPTSDVLDPDDVLDDVLDTGTGEPENTGTTFVCDVVTDHGVCGESFNTPMKLGAHKYGKHGIRGKSDRATHLRGKDKKPGGRTTKKATTAPKQATAKAMGPPTDRAAVYTASLSMAAIGCYLALPPFDQRDLDVCNAGLPNVGRALAQLADTNPSVARTCDLILAGGGGGWIALLMAVVPIAGGIAANHGVIPASSGERFGEMIGLAPAMPVPSAGVAPPPVSPEPTESVADNVIEFFDGQPETVMADATEKMMRMGGPVGVRVPMTVTENPDGHRGSEQLRPVAPTPTEREPETAVSEA